METKIVLGVLSLGGLSILSERHTDTSDIMKVGRLLNRMGFFDTIKDEEITNFQNQVNEAFCEYFDVNDTLIFTAEINAQEIDDIKSKGDFTMCVHLIDSYEKNQMKILITPSDKSALYIKLFSETYKGLYNSNIWSIYKGRDLGLI